MDCTSEVSSYQYVATPNSNLDDTVVDGEILENESDGHLAQGPGGSQDVLAGGCRGSEPSYPHRIHRPTVSGDCTRTSSYSDRSPAERVSDGLAAPVPEWPEADAVVSKPRTARDLNIRRPSSNTVTRRTPREVRVSNVRTTIF